MEHKVDYLCFNGSREGKLLNVQNSLNKTSIDSVLISWVDTSSYRLANYGKTTTLDVLFNGESFNNYKDEYIHYLNEYTIGIVSFDDKESLQSKYA